ncbi:YaiA family protein [Tatumella ptyseos]|uniref:YaiA family protein n=1 Tax=Tatumella ptyseos TaxID=82987 RepID=UPI0026EEADBB|nr:YaiA family protein [Tatumella ptyseos]WKX27579.1 YaiA family protein [Tatumella ptyseos]
MAGHPPYPRKAWIVEVSDGQGEEKVGHYELRADHPYPDTLISQYRTRQEAEDAKERYIGEDKE